MEVIFLQEEKVLKATDALHGINQSRYSGNLKNNKFRLNMQFFMWTESLVDSGPTTSLPDKKLLVFVLDRLQKCVVLALRFSFFKYYYVMLFNWGLIGLCVIYFRKDTYGVFSEPVDPEEVLFFFWETSVAYV